MRGARDQPWRETDAGLALRVRVMPRASRQDVEGIEQTAQGAALRVRVRAAPRDGAANVAAMATIADWLGVARRQVSLAGGDKSRVKLVAISGDAASLVAALHDRLGQIGSDRGR